MKRSFIALILLFASSICIQAQQHGMWDSARERGLRGAVHSVVSSCSDIKGTHETRFKYDFARDGTLITITAPQFQSFDCIIAAPTSHKITRRNNSGDVTEASLLVYGELAQKERYELEYDSVGNWIKLVTIVMRVYEIEGGSWKAGEWRVQSICHQTIEYYS